MNSDAALGTLLNSKGFSLLAGGPLHRLARSLGLLNTRAGFVRFGVGIALLTWVPLLVLTALERTFSSGPVIPFLQSLGTHTRLLAAIPLFFAAEALFNVRAAEAMRLIVVARLVSPPHQPRLDRALIRTTNWCDSWVVEAALAVFTMVFMWVGLRLDLPAEISTWRTATDGPPTLAGWWYSLVSLPVFQFLVWRWAARLLIWGALLWRLGRLDLRLIPTHPDLAGGLGGLGVAQVALMPLIFAAMSMLVASYSEQVLYGGANVRAFVLPLTGFIVGITAAAVAPLLVLAPRLFETKQQGLLDYGVLGEAYVRAFDAKWVRGDNPSNEQLLGSADIQSLADLSNAFSGIRNMRFVPISFPQVFGLVVAAVLPTAPLVLFVVPLDQLILDGLRAVFL